MRVNALDGLAEYFNSEIDKMKIPTVGLEFARPALLNLVAAAAVVIVLNRISNKIK